MKKLDKETALAKISALIKKHFEDIGREIVDDVEIAKDELIDEIDGILNQTEISVKHLIIEKLEVDEEMKKSLKGRWKANDTFK